MEVTRSTTGTGSASAENTKILLDSAAKRIVSASTTQYLQNIQNALVDHAFRFEGMASHQVTLIQCISRELSGNFFFEALSKKALSLASVSRFLLRILPFPRLMLLIASNNVASVASLLLHALDATSHSFLNPQCCRRRRLSARTADLGSFALAATDHLLRVRPLLCPSTAHFTALLNQSREVEVVAAASASRPAPPAAQSSDAPVHVSCDESGNMYVCGANKSAIRVLDSNGRLKCDLTIKNADGSDVPVKFLRATTVDWSSGNIYVTDREADVLHCITPSGQLKASLPSGVCNKPRGLSWCAVSRRVAVADYDGHQVIVLDADLNVVTKLKGAKADGDSFQNPIDVAFDANGFLYVLDSRNNRHALSHLHHSSISLFFPFCVRVVVMDDSYSPMLTIGSKGRSDGMFDNREPCLHNSAPAFVLTVFVSYSHWHLHRWERKIIC